VQDEMIELQEREEQRDTDEREAEERAVHVALMKDANLDGVENLLEDMIQEDPEWAKLQQVPSLVDCWNDTRDKFNLATDEFKVSPAPTDVHTDIMIIHPRMPPVAEAELDQDGHSAAALGISVLFCSPAQPLTAAKL
jgi:hypothetical protein